MPFGELIFSRSNLSEQIAKGDLEILLDLLA